MRLEDFPTPNPDFERLRRIIMREEEPDRVPFFDIQIDPEIMAAIMGEPVPAMLDTDPEQIRKKLLKDMLYSPNGLKCIMQSELSLVFGISLSYRKIFFDG